MPAPIPKIMGVLNATPDSFSDGGRFENLDAGLRLAGARQQARPYDNVIGPAVERDADPALRGGHQAAAFTRR